MIQILTSTVEVWLLLLHNINIKTFLKFQTSGNLTWRITTKSHHISVGVIRRPASCCHIAELR